MVFVRLDTVIQTPIMLLDFRIAKNTHFFFTFITYLFFDIFFMMLKLLDFVDHGLVFLSFSLIGS